MGWLWSSEQQASPRSTGDAPVNRDVLPSNATVAEASSTPLADSPANGELLAFFDALPNEQKSPLLKGTSASESAQSSRLRKVLSANASSAPSERLTPENLYPSEVSCRALFDQAFYCQSMGGHVLSIYRYGRSRSCSQHWTNFWWCMRTNRSASLSDEERREEVQQHYWEQDQRTRKQPEGSSEDVWQQRRYKLNHGVFVSGEQP